MRRSGFRSSSVSVFVLLAFSSATLATTSARADLPFPMADPYVGSDPAAPAAAAPPQITPLASPPPGAQPIELREVFWGDRYGQVRHGPFPFQGNRPLDGAAFYRALGREDLASAYETRAGVKVALGISALAAIVVGALVLKGATPETQCESPPSKYAFQIQAPVCQTDSKNGTLATGIVVLAAGPILMITAAAAIDTDPVSPTERRKLIDAFNASLAHATADGAPARPKPGGVSFTVSPTLSTSGAGLTVGGRF